MRRTRLTCFVIFLFLALTPVFGQKRSVVISRIAVVPFVNSTGNQQWDALAASISDTLLLTLRLADQITVRDIGSIDPYSAGGLDEIQQKGQESRLDAVLIGNLTLVDGDRVNIAASLYSPAAGEIIASETRTAFGAFDVLDAADELAVAVASGIAGYSVDFGAIILEPSRTDVRFRVYIDGALAGESIRGVPQVLVGDRRLDITVLSRAGEQLVYSADLQIRPGEANSVSFPLPAVTQTEADMIGTRLSFVERNFFLPDKGEAVEVALREARELMSGAERPEDEASLARAQRLVNIEQEFRAIAPDNYWDEEAAALVVPFEESIPVAYNLRGVATPGDKELESRILRSALAHAYLTRLGFGLALADGQWETADALVDEIERTQNEFSLRSTVMSDTEIESYRGARVEADELSGRRKRPWPYLISVLGAGGIGYGSYLGVTDVVGTTLEDADKLYAEYLAADLTSVSAARAAAEEKYDEAELMEQIQWAAIGSGALVLTTGIILAVRNIRKSDNYMRSWADQTYPRLMSVASGIAGFSVDGRQRRGRDSEEDLDRATLLLLGPEEIVTAPDGVVDLLPFLISVPSGQELVVNRPAVVSSDSVRLWSAGMHLVVLE